MSRLIAIPVFAIFLMLLFPGCASDNSAPVPAPGQGNGGQMPGSDRDSHGCIGSAGYSWCEGKQKCLRAWEEPCTPADREAKALRICGGERISQVSVCGDMIVSTSTLLGGGSTIHFDNGSSISCPVVSPEFTSADCAKYLSASNCIKRTICSPASVKLYTSDQLDSASTASVRAIFLANNQTVGVEVASAAEVIAHAANDGYSGGYPIARTPENEKSFKWVGPLSSSPGSYIAFSKGTPTSMVQAYQSALDGLKSG